MYVYLCACVGVLLCVHVCSDCAHVCAIVTICMQCISLCLSVSVCIGGSQGEADHKTTGGKQEGGRFQEMVRL